MSFHLHVFNLRSTTTNQNLRHLFKNMAVEEDGVTIIGGPGGEAFVTFENQTDLLRAMKMNGVQHLKFKIATDLEKLEAINKMCIAKLNNLGKEPEMLIQTEHVQAPTHRQTVRSLTTEDKYKAMEDIDIRHKKSYESHVFDEDRDDRPSHSATSLHSHPDYYSHILSTVEAVTQQGYSKFDQMDPQHRNMLHTDSTSRTSSAHFDNKKRCVSPKSGSPMDISSDSEDSVRIEHSSRREDFLRRKSSPHSAQSGHNPIMDNRHWLEPGSKKIYTHLDHPQLRQSRGFADRADVDRSPDRHGNRGLSSSPIGGRYTDQQAIGHMERSPENKVGRYQRDERTLSSSDKLMYPRPIPTQATLGTTGMLGPRDAGYLSAHRSNHSEMIGRRGEELSIPTDRHMSTRYSDDYDLRYKDSRDPNRDRGNYDTASQGMYRKDDTKRSYVQRSVDQIQTDSSSGDNSDQCVRIERILKKARKFGERKDTDDKEMDKCYDDRHHRRSRSIEYERRGQGENRDLNYESDLVPTYKENLLDPFIDHSASHKTDRKVDIVMRAGHVIAKRYDGQHDIRPRDMASCRSRADQRYDGSHSRDRFPSHPQSPRPHFDDPKDYNIGDARHIINTRRRDERIGKRFDDTLDASTSQISDLGYNERLPSPSRQSYSDSESGSSIDSALHSNKRRRLLDNMRKKNVRSSDEDYDTYSNRGRDRRKKPRYASNESSEYSAKGAAKKQTGLRYGRYRQDSPSRHSLSPDFSNLESNISDHSDWHSSRGRSRDKGEVRSKKRKNRDDDTSEDDEHKDSQRETYKGKKQRGTERNYRKRQSPKTDPLKMSTTVDDIDTHQSFLAIYQMKPTTTATDVLFWCDDGVTAYKINFFGETGPKGSEAMAFVLFDNKELSRNAEATVTEKGLSTQRYDLYAGYRFMTQLGDTCTVTQTEYWGDRLVSLEDRNLPPFVVTEFTLDKVTDMVYLCITGFSRQFNPTASQVWRWFYGAKGVVLSTTGSMKSDRGDSGLAKAAVIAFGSHSELAEGLDKAKYIWKSHKKFTAKEALSFLSASLGSHEIKVSTTTTKDRGLTDGEKKLLTNSKRTDTATVMSFEIKPGCQNPILLKAEAIPGICGPKSDKASTASEEDNITLDKGHVQKKSPNKSDPKKEDMPRKPRSISEKHHIKSDKEHSTSDKSKRSNSTSENVKPIPNKMSPSFSNATSFLWHLKTIGGMADSANLILTLYREKRSTSACDILAAYPTALCVLKVNFHTTGPQGGESLAYILFKSKGDLPTHSLITKTNNDFKLLTRTQADAFLYRLRGTSQITESTSTVDRVLSMKDLRRRALTPRFTLTHNLPKMHYIEIKVDPLKTASQLLTMFQKYRASPPLGALVSVRKRDHVSYEGYLAYGHWAVRQSAASFAQRYGAAKITMMTENGVLERLKKFSDDYYIMVSTFHGKDRKLSPDEEALLKNQKNKVEESSSHISKSVSFKHGSYIQLTKVAPKITGCEILAGYISESYKAKSVTLVCDPNNVSIAAFVRFENKKERDSAIPMRPFSKHCNARARMVWLSRLRKENTILESTESGKDRVISSKKACPQPSPGKETEVTPTETVNAGKVKESKVVEQKKLTKPTKSKPESEQGTADVQQLKVTEKMIQKKSDKSEKGILESDKASTSSKNNEALKKSSNLKDGVEMSHNKENVLMDKENGSKPITEGKSNESVPMSKTIDSISSENNSSVVAVVDKSQAIEAEGISKPMVQETNIQLPKVASKLIDISEHLVKEGSLDVQKDGHDQVGERDGTQQIMEESREQALEEDESEQDKDDHEHMVEEARSKQVVEENDSKDVAEKESEQVPEEGSEQVARKDGEEVVEKGECEQVGERESECIIDDDTGHVAEEDDGDQLVQNEDRWEQEVNEGSEQGVEENDVELLAKDEGEELMERDDIEQLVEEGDGEEGVDKDDIDYMVKEDERVLERYDIEEGAEGDDSEEVMEDGEGVVESDESDEGEQVVEDNVSRQVVEEDGNEQMVDKDDIEHMLEEDENEQLVEVDGMEEGEEKDAGEQVAEEEESEEVEETDNVVQLVEENDPEQLAGRDIDEQMEGQCSKGQILMAESVQEQEEDSEPVPQNMDTGSVQIDHEGIVPTGDNSCSKGMEKVKSARTEQLTASPSLRRSQRVRKS